MAMTQASGRSKNSTNCHVVHPVRYTVVDGTALNSKLSPMARHGYFDSGYGPMLSFDFTWERSWWTDARLPAEWNWLLKSFARQDSAGVAKKNRCLALGLLEINRLMNAYGGLTWVRPPWAFMSLLSCSHAWSARGWCFLSQTCALFQFFLCEWMGSCLRAYLLCIVARVACI